MLLLPLLLLLLLLLLLPPLLLLLLLLLHATNQLQPAKRCSHFLVQSMMQLLSCSPKCYPCCCCYNMKPLNCSQPNIVLTSLFTSRCSWVTFPPIRCLHCLCCWRCCCNKEWMPVLSPL
jgi:hypothetical protein